MLQKPRVPPSLKSIKSLPVDYRSAGAATSDGIENSGDLNIKHTEVTGMSIPENSQLKNEYAGAVDNEESPYSRKNVPIEDRALMGDEGLDSVASPLSAVSTSHSERRWGDTTPYAAKKVP